MTMHKSKLFSILLISLLVLMEDACFQKSDMVLVSGPVAVGNEWIELRPKEPLTVDKDFQMVVLDLEPPFRFDLMGEGHGPNKAQGILMPDGDVINPEIVLIDEAGNEFRLVFGGAKGPAPSPFYKLRYPDKLPGDRKYKLIRIRSDRSFECQAIYWFCESIKDWP